MLWEWVRIPLLPNIFYFFNPFAGPNKEETKYSRLAERYRKMKEERLAKNAMVEERAKKVGTERAAMMETKSSSGDTNKFGWDLEKVDYQVIIFKLFVSDVHCHLTLCSDRGL